MNNEPETDAEKHSFDWLLGRTTMSNTPRTDKLFGGFAATDDGYWKVLDHARQLERELAAKDAEADTARLDWLLQDTELDLFFADREEIDAAMKEASK